MKIKKIRDVKTPTRGTARSAGIDFYVPNDYNDGKKIYERSILPGESVTIASGIKVEVPKGFVLVAMNKSGVAIKKGLQVGACVIDEDYQGEVFIHLVNIGSYAAYISAGQKIVQMVLLPADYSEIEVVDTIHEEVSERGEGSQGSTGIV